MTKYQGKRGMRYLVWLHETPRLVCALTWSLPGCSCLTACGGGWKLEAGSIWCAFACLFVRALLGVCLDAVDNSFNWELGHSSLLSVCDCDVCTCLRPCVCVCVMIQRVCVKVLGVLLSSVLAH